MTDTPEYLRGWHDNQASTDAYLKALADRVPVEKSVLRLAAEQGLCPSCKEVILRMANRK